MTGPFRFIVLASFVLILQAALPGPAARADAQAACGEIDASAITDALQEGERVLLDDCTVTGNLSLSSLRTVSAPLVLTGATFEGRVEASFLVFQSVVDFTGSDFREAPDFSGSIFQADAVFADVSLSSGASDATIGMRRIAFQGDADFRRAEFHGMASFEDTSFGRRALFQSAHFFTESTFTGASLKDAAVFANCRYDGPAHFDSTTASGDLNFEASTFKNSVDFRNAVLAGDLSLPRSRIEGKPFFLDDVTARSIDLRGVIVTDGGELSFSEPTVESLFMDIDTVDHIDSGGDDAERILALRLIEHTYRGEGELDKANKASFRRQAIEDGNRDQPEQAFRVVLFHWIGGYSVRPLHPLITAVIVVLLGTAVRLLRDPKYGMLATLAPLAARARGSRVPSRDTPDVDSDWPWQARAADAFVNAAKVPVTLKPGELLSDDERKQFLPYLVAGLLLIEYVIHKALNLAFLIAIGNAIPGARDFIDAILP